MLYAKLGTIAVVVFTVLQRVMAQIADRMLAELALQPQTPQNRKEQQYWENILEELAQAPIVEF